MKQEELKIRNIDSQYWYWVDNEFDDFYGMLFGPTGISVYKYLCRKTDNKTQRCFPSEETIANYIGSTDRTVRKCIKSFIQCNIISCNKKWRGVDGQWRSNEYTLLNRNQWMKPWEIISRGYNLNTNINIFPWENKSKSQGNSIPINNTQEKNTNQSIEKEKEKLKEEILAFRGSKKQPINNLY